MNSVIVRLLIGLISLVIVLVCVTGLGLPVTKSQATEPHREVLLNGLRVLVWSRPNDQNVVLKLRIHSGAAFDTARKAGTMALLGDILFPDAATHEYFTEEMGGQLNVDTDYDAINITLRGRAADYDRIVDILRAALVTTPLTPANVIKVRDARIKALTEKKVSVSEVADQAIAVRLLGAFPYAQQIGGTPESLNRIERADLMLARERFLNPDNATLAIIGGVDEHSAMRALRQLLGGWRKSDGTAPATFRQPDPPDTRTLILNSSESPRTTVRLATRGLARSDHDYFAAKLLAQIAQDRLHQISPDLNNDSSFVHHDAHFLPGMFVLGGTADRDSVAKRLNAFRDLLNSLAAAPCSSIELESAKRNVLAASKLSATGTNVVLDDWLDVDTYELSSTDEQVRALSAVTPADLQRVAVRLLRDAPVASIVVGNSAELKAELSPTQKIQVAGEVATPITQPQRAPDQTPTTRRPTPILPRTRIINPLLKDPKPTPTPE